MPAGKKTSPGIPVVDGRDPEVSERPVRRRFSAEYKLQILRQADACTESGQLGELLRREGLYSSHLSTWRSEREQGTLDALTPKKRGRKPRDNDPLIEENRRLERVNKRLVERLRQAEVIIDVQKKVAEILGIPLQSPEPGEHRLMNAVTQLASEVGTAPACAASACARATFYRHRQVADRPCQEKPRPTPPRALSAEERRAVLDTLHSERFADQAPAEVYATLLDEGRYLCSIRTMYRLLDDSQEVRERRDQLRHPHLPQAANWWPPGRIRSGPGTSPSCWGRPSGRTSTCT